MMGVSYVDFFASVNYPIERGKINDGEGKIITGEKSLRWREGIESNAQVRRS